MVSLYELLQDRAAVNMLKVLYDNDGQRAYATKLGHIQQRLGMPALPVSAQRLLTAGLANADAVGHDAVFSITEKGKHFIEIFDQLIAVTNGQRIGKKHNGMSIRYALTQLEKQMLVAVEKICAGSGKSRISVHAVSRELYPSEEPKEKVAALLRYAQQLTELGLLRHEQIGKNTLLGLTEQGSRIIQEQYLREG